MIIYPQLNPVLFSIGGWQIYWYGFLYMCGFLSFLLLAQRAVIKEKLPFTKDKIASIMQYSIIGVIIGGRLGYCLFYAFSKTVENPLYIFSITQGGMSFHGGLIGVAVSLVIFAKTSKIPFFSISDLVVRYTPIGLGLGRIGNFINGELWGREGSVDVPWLMVFPHVDNVARHPSMLYEALGEGLVLYLLLYYHRSLRPSTGVLSALFFVYYGVIRFFIEFTREPDRHIGYFFNFLTLGQILCIVTAILGLILLKYTRK